MSECYWEDEEENITPEESQEREREMRKQGQDAEAIMREVRMNSPSSVQLKFRTVVMDHER